MSVLQEGWATDEDVQEVTTYMVSLSNSEFLTCFDKLADEIVDYDNLDPYLCLSPVTPPGLQQEPPPEPEPEPDEEDKENIALQDTNRKRSNDDVYDDISTTTAPFRKRYRAKQLAPRTTSSEIAEFPELGTVIPDSYDRTSFGPCCLCGTTDTGPNAAWYSGLCGPKSFCSHCYRANNPNYSRMLWYAYCVDKEGKKRLVLHNESQRWKEKNFPKTVYASTRLQEAFESLPEKKRDKFKNWFTL